MSILRERIFLAKMHSPFIVNMFLSFQNKYNLFLIMELLTGGDLRYHLLNYNFYFTETQIKFILSNIILGIEYIHKKGIVHRDLKPENVILNDQGYVKITDFGISCKKKDLDKSDDSGTPAYMAPETIVGDKQDYSVDYYSLGVIGYELLKGKVPYDANDREEILDMMKNNEINLKADERLRETFSDFCLDFITKLLKKNPSQRLGSKKGEEELKKHCFFSGLDWDLIESRKFKSPVYDVIQYSKIKHGNIKELFDFDYCNKSEHLSPKMAQLYVKITKDINYPNYFKFYTCVCVENLMRELKEEERKMRKKKKKLKRSSSIGDFYNIQDNYPYNKLSDFNLPFLINNPTEIIRQNRKREKKLKKYYENEILKYKDELDLLMNDYHIKKDQISNIKEFVPHKHKKQLKDNNDNFFPNFDFQPEPFLPFLGQGKIMNNFYNGINGNPDKFFYKNKGKKDYPGKPQKYDSSDYFTIDSGLDDNLDDVKVYNNFPLPPPIFPNMNFDNNYGFGYDNPYSDPYIYEENKKEKPRIKDTNLKKNKIRYNTKISSKPIVTRGKDDEKKDD